MQRPALGSYTTPGDANASWAEAALKKTRCADCGALHRGWYDRTVRRVRDLSCGDTRVYLEIEVRRVLCRASGKVRRERLEFLADNPLYTKRFATFVGLRCRVSTIKDVAKELRLDWETVKELDKQYMRAQLARAGTPAPRVIGIDEIAIRKGYIYRIVVSDLGDVGHHLPEEIVVGTLLNERLQGHSVDRHGSLSWLLGCRNPSQPRFGP